MHVTLRYTPDFILKEEPIQEDIWQSASLGGCVSAPLTSTGMRLLQTCMCFCFENLQEKKKKLSKLQQGPDSSIQWAYENCSTGLTTLCDQSLSNRRFSCISLHFLNSCNTHFICYILILEIFIIGIYTIHLNEFQDLMVQPLKCYYNFFIWIDQNALDKSVKTLIKMQDCRNDSWKRGESQAFCE